MMLQDHESIGEWDDDRQMTAEKKAELANEAICLGILNRTDLERAWVGDYSADEYPGMEID